VKALLDELLGTQGSKVSVAPSKLYVNSCELVSFWTIAKRASSQGTIILGYHKEHSIEPFVLNPPGKDEPKTWDMFELAVIVKAGAMQPSNETGSFVE